MKPTLPKSNHPDTDAPFVFGALLAVGVVLGFILSLRFR